MIRKSKTAIKAFMKMETSGGIILILAALCALIFANSALVHGYESFLESKLVLQFGGYDFTKSVHWWINDGLMAIFFLLVAMEIKREVLEGELSTRKQAVLPMVGAIGGVIAPALIYTFLNYQTPEIMHGWAIPTATDIAFALGVLALFGKRVPLGLKIFLTAVAVIDDLMAIVIIALFYTADIHINALAMAGCCMAVLWVMNRFKIPYILPFLLVGVVLWLAVYESGVHATIAGVLLGFMIPHRAPKSMLKKMEHALHPWVAFAIMPIFAFANSGINFAGMGLDSLMEPVPLGIAKGLFFGKQIGIFLACWLAIRLGFAQLPTGANWKQFYAICILCGIGFTMSLFIGSLSFNDPHHLVMMRVGVMAGSLASALVGCLLLHVLLPKKRVG